MEVSWPSGNCPDYPDIQLPFASEPTSLHHTVNRKDSPPILNSLRGNERKQIWPLLKVEPGPQQWELDLISSTLSFTVMYWVPDF